MIAGGFMLDFWSGVIALVISLTLQYVSSSTIAIEFFSFTGTSLLRQTQEVLRTTRPPSLPSSPVPGPLPLTKPPAAPKGYSVLTEGEDVTA